MTTIEGEYDDFARDADSDDSMSNDSDHDFERDKLASSLASTHRRVDSVDK